MSRVFLVNKEWRGQLLAAGNDKIAQDRVLDELCRKAGQRDIIAPDDNRLAPTLRDAMRARRICFRSWEDYNTIAQAEYNAACAAKAEGTTTNTVSLPQQSKVSPMPPRVGKTARDGGETASLKRKAERRLEDRERHNNKMKSAGGKKNKKNK